MESNILVKLDDAIEWCLTSEGNERSAHRKKDESDIKVEGKSCGTRNWIAETEYRTGIRKIVLEKIVQETEGEDHCVDEHEDENEDSSVSFVDKPVHW